MAMYGTQPYHSSTIFGIKIYYTYGSCGRDIVKTCELRLLWEPQVRPSGLSQAMSGRGMDGMDGTTDTFHSFGSIVGMAQ